MFNKAIWGTTLASDAAGRLFSNITAADMPDQSFLSTLRALLRKRLPQNETIQLSYRELHLTEDAVTGMPVSHAMNLFAVETVRFSVAHYNISIVTTTNADAGKKMLEIVRANAGIGRRYLGDYFRKDDLQVFYARKVNALFYIYNNRNTVIFVDHLELKHFHALQMMIPKYLPGLFTDNPLTETETALLKSAGNKSAVEYETLIDEFAKDLDIRAEIIRGKLAGFETVSERVRVDEIKGEINTFQTDYDYHISMIRDISNKIQERKYVLAGLECEINGRSEDSELMEYFICNKNLSLMDVTGTRMVFIAHGYADIYDQDAFKQYVGNHRGYMYDNIGSAAGKVQLEKLYRAVFGEGRYKLRICAAYTADMRNGLTAYKAYSFPPESQTYMPNPHIQSFGCIGSYVGRFQEYMRNKDYVGAIDQAIVSARNLNFYDSPVISSFARDFYCTTRKCIEKPDGSLLTPLEAIFELEGGDTECQDPLF